MRKVDWYYLCLEMIMEYIPKNLDTRENYNKFQEICDHFLSVSKILSARIKTEQNVDCVMIDESEEVKKVSQLLKRLARQNLEFLKQRLIEEGLYAESR